MGGRWPRGRLSCSHASRRLLSSASLWSRKSARLWPLPLGRAVEAGLPSWPSPRQWTPLLCSHTQDGSEVAVKEVLAGDSVHSLLSILDVITVSAPPTPRARQPGLLPRTVGHRRRGLGGRASPQSWLLTAVGCLLNNCIGTGSPPHVGQDPKGPQRHGWKRPLLPRGTHLAPPGHCHGVALYGVDSCALVQSVEQSSWVPGAPPSTETKPLMLLPQLVSCLRGGFAGLVGDGTASPVTLGFLSVYHGTFQTFGSRQAGRDECVCRAPAAALPLASPSLDSFLLSRVHAITQTFPHVSNAHQRARLCHATGALILASPRKWHLLC